MFAKFFTILDNSKGKFLLVFSFYFLSSVLDILGISLIVPYIEIFLNNNESIIETHNLGILKNFFNKHFLLNYFGLIIIFIFFFKIDCSFFY